MQQPPDKLRLYLGDLAVPLAESANRKKRTLSVEARGLLHSCLDRRYVLDTAHQIIEVIEADLNDRKGLHLDSLDPQIKRDIKLAWEKAIVKVLEHRSV